MPDPYRKLTAAVVEIATQARRIADAMQTPVVETVVAAPTTHDDALRQLVDGIRTLRPADAPSVLRQQIADALEAADYRQDMRRGDLADSVMPVVERLRLERDTLRGWLDGDSLQVIDEMVDEHARLSARARTAEEQRDQLAAAALEVLHLIDTEDDDRDVSLSRLAEPLRAVLDPPATEEQRAAR